MDKKRVIRLLPAVVLALLLVGDGVFYARTSPSLLFSTPPSFQSGEGVGNPEDGSEQSEDEEAGATQEHPDSGDTEGAQERPDSGTEEGSTPSHFGAPGKGSGNRSAFRLMRWRFLCLPAGLVLAALEIVTLLRLRRKRNASEKAERQADEDPAEQRMRSERRARRIGIEAVCGVLVLALLLQVVRSTMGESASVTVNEEVRTAEASEGTLESSLQSSGVVASAQEETLSVPGSITVTEYLVSDGDAVEAGDDVAVLERSSVLSAIADVQTLLQKLDEKMDDVLDSSASSYVTAPTDATVVKVYASSGESVTDVMYHHGSLALLSLDGLLAVKIENPGGYTIGDELKVTDSGGHSETGRISKVEKDSLLITVDLDDFSCDEKVTVTDKKDKKLGTGKLFVYSPLRITGYSGTVKSVHRSAGASVSKGSKLFTLSDAERTAEYQTLLRKRSKLVEQYNRLMNISKTGRLTAEQSGLISGLDQSLLSSAEDAEEETAEEPSATQNRSQTATVEATSAQTMGVRANPVQAMGLRSGSGAVNLRAAVPAGDAVFLSAQLEEQEMTQEPETTEEQGTTQEPETKEEQETTPEQTEKGESESEEQDGTSAEQSAENTEEKTDQDSGSETAGDSAQDSQGGDTSTDGSQESDEATVSRSVLVRWRDKTGAALASGLPMELVATLKADGTAVDTAKLNADSGWSKSWEGLSAGSSYTVSYDVPSGFTGSAELSGDTIVLTFTQSEQGGEAAGQGEGQKSGKMPDKGKAGTSMSAAFGQSETGTSDAYSEQTAEEEDDSYTMEETTLGRCISNDRVCVDVSVDELDVNSITIGQEATVTLDALEGQSFAGTVTALSASGTNEGGNTKYTMTVTMDKDSSVLLGMSACVRLVTESSETLLLPEAAIVEEQGRTWVYTSYDEKEDELGGLTEVSTGRADGENVEILSGLEQGAACYYRYADSIHYSFMR